MATIARIQTLIVQQKIEDNIKKEDDSKVQQEKVKANFEAMNEEPTNDKKVKGKEMKDDVASDIKENGEEPKERRHFFVFDTRSMVMVLGTTEALWYIFNLVGSFMVISESVFDYAMRISASTGRTFQTGVLAFALFSMSCSFFRTASNSYSLM